MKHEFLTCDKCGYSEENAGCIVKHLRIDMGNDTIDWEDIELCADCLRTYKLENPNAKIYEL